MTQLNTDSNPQAALIKANKITHSFGNNRVLHDVSLQIRAKEIVTLIGPNGAGKSTLLKILLGLITPNQGQVSLQANLKIGFMPQKIHVDPTLPMSVKRFLELGLPKTKNALTPLLAAPFFTKFNESFIKSKQNKQAQNKAGYYTTMFNKTVADLNLESLLDQSIQKVSGGEMQRILLARALIRDPQLLVLDEPVQGVDIQGQTEIYDYINKIRQERGCGILMVSHDLHVVMRHTDNVLCLNQHLCCTGHPQAISQSNEFKALFGDFSDSIAFYEHHHNHDACEHEHGHHEHDDLHANQEQTQHELTMHKQTDQDTQLQSKGSQS